MSQGSVDELMKEPASDLLCRFQGEVLYFLRGYFHSFALSHEKLFFGKVLPVVRAMMGTPISFYSPKINWLRFCLHEPLHVPHSPSTISLGRLKNKDRQSNVKLFASI